MANKFYQKHEEHVKDVKIILKKTKQKSEKSTRKMSNFY